MQRGHGLAAAGNREVEDDVGAAAETATPAKAAPETAATVDAATPHALKPFDDYLFRRQRDEKVAILQLQSKKGASADGSGPKCAECGVAYPTFSAAMVCAATCSHQPTTHPEGSAGRRDEEEGRIQEKARLVGKEPTTLGSKMRGFWTKTKDFCSLLRAGPELSFQAGPYVVEGSLTEAGAKLAAFLASERFYELRYAIDSATDIQYTTNTFSHIRQRTICKNGDGGEERVTETRFVCAVEFRREMQRGACSPTSAMAAAAVLLIEAYPPAQQPSMLRSWGPALKGERPEI